MQNNQLYYFLPSCLPKNNFYHLRSVEKHRLLSQTHISVQILDGLPRHPREFILIVLQFTQTRMYMEFYKISSLTITGVHQKCNNFLSEERTTFIQYITVQKVPSYLIWS